LNSLLKKYRHVEVWYFRSTQEAVEDPSTVDCCAFTIDDDVLSANRVGNYVSTLSTSVFQYFLCIFGCLLVVDCEISTQLVLTKCKLFVV